MSLNIHHVPGRLRIKIPEIKGDQKKGREILQAIQDLNGIDTVSINQVTGSVIIRYEEDVIYPEQIIHILKDKGYLNPSGHGFKNQKRDRASNAGVAVGKALFGWALGKAFEGTGLSFLTVFI